MVLFEENIKIKKLTLRKIITYRWCLSNRALCNIEHFKRVYYSVYISELCICAFKYFRLQEYIKINKIK